jgi:hypothetical protein
MAGVWAWELESRQQGREGVSAGTATELGRTRTQSSTVILTFSISAHRVFDTMSARYKVLNFENFPLGFYPVMDKDPIHMLVWSRDDGLVEKGIDMRMVSV